MRTRPKVQRLGYRDTVSVSGIAMRIDKACSEYPVELFELIHRKEVWVSERIYQNLLDYLRSIDHPLYYEHRKPYHDKVVSDTVQLQKQELDYVVRNKLKGEEIRRVEMTVKGKTRSYTSIDAVSDGREFSFTRSKGVFKSNSKKS